MPNKMYIKTVLSKTLAKQIAEIAEVVAIKNSWAISIAIVNDSMQLIYFLKMDESTAASADISIAKAKHSAYYRRDTKFHHDLLIAGNHAVLGLPNAMPVEGGVQLIYKGNVVGAIGISGAASDADGLVARAGADFLLTILKDV